MTWRRRYVPQVGQAACGSFGLRHCGQVTSVGAAVFHWERPGWHCSANLPLRNSHFSSPVRLLLLVRNIYLAKRGPPGVHVVAMLVVRPPWRGEHRIRRTVQASFRPAAHDKPPLKHHRVPEAGSKSSRSPSRNRSSTSASSSAAPDSYRYSSWKLTSIVEVTGSSHRAHSPFSGATAEPVTSTPSETASNRRSRARPRRWHQRLAPLRHHLARAPVPGLVAERAWLPTEAAHVEHKVPAQVPAPRCRRGRSP